MFWMFVRTILLALYILSGLGIIVMNLTMRRDLEHLIKEKGVKIKPYPLSEKVAAKISYLINISCPIWNFIIFLIMVFNAEKVLAKAFDSLMDRQIFDEEEE